jgi:hypothetical protein
MRISAVRPLFAENWHQWQAGAQTTVGTAHSESADSSDGEALRD